MKKKHNKIDIKTILFIILIFSGIIRLSLAYVNNYMDDPQYNDIEYILETGNLPSREDGTCDSSCDTPKLYYWFNAKLIQLFNFRQINPIRFLNIVHAIVGIITIYYALLFINALKLKKYTKIAIFSLVAFNPGLIRVNIQIIPHTFVICFSVIASYYAFKFFKTKTNYNFLMMTFFCILALITKTNSIVLFFCILAVLVFSVISEKKNMKQNIIYLNLFLFLILLIVPFFGGYITNYKTKGSFFIYKYHTNEKETPLYFFKETYTTDPGIISFYRGYLTFPIVSLIKHPRIRNYLDSPDWILEAHTTSLWTQIYARSLFIPYSCGMFNGNDVYPHSLNLRFEQMPIYMFIGRMVLVLGLVLILLFFLGFFNILKSLVKKKLSKEHIFFSLLSIMYLLFMVVFTMRYRNYYRIKDIYMYPGLFGYIYVVSNGLDNLKKAYKPVLVIIGVIIFLHLMDLLFIFIPLLNTII